MNKNLIFGSMTAVSLMAAAPLGAEGLAQAVVLEREMIVTANPLASAAGAKILKNGGTAADANALARAGEAIGRCPEGDGKVEAAAFEDDRWLVKPL